MSFNRQKGGGESNAYKKLRSHGTWPLNASRAPQSVTLSLTRSLKWSRWEMLSIYFMSALWSWSSARRHSRQQCLLPQVPLLLRRVSFTEYRNVCRTALSLNMLDTSGTCHTAGLGSGDWTHISGSSWAVPSLGGARPWVREQTGHRALLPHESPLPEA